MRSSSLNSRRENGPLIGDMDETVPIKTLRYLSSDNKLRGGCGMS